VRDCGGGAIDPAEIPDGDEAAGDLMSRGDTLGVFQLESPGMRNLLKMLKTRDLNGAIAALSLIRPGPAGSGMKERFIRRARGLEPLEHLDSRLADVLADTYGVMLYEEDVMQVSATIAGLSLAEGDLLRRAITEIKDAGEEMEVAGTFIARAIRNGTVPRVAEALWKDLRRFGAYAFCKAHASGYGVLAYQGAWLKAHHPAAWAVAILNNHTAMYHQRVHLEDAKRHGVRILLPCVNRSEKEYALEMAGPAAQLAPGPAIRIGLDRVKDLSEATIERILAERGAAGRQTFADLSDFLRRVRPLFREAENLILAGAFDFTNRTRPELLCELRMTYVAHMRAARAEASTGAPALLFDVRDATPRGPDLRDFDAAQQHGYEFEVLELSAGAHPMSLFDTREFLSSAGLDAMRGRRVKMAGVVAAHRRVATKTGQTMMFLTLDDVEGLFECTLFPAVFRRYGVLLRDLGPYVVEGRAEEQYGAVTVNVEKLSRLEGL
jgi:DNA polymerase III alpha subunit